MIPYSRWFENMNAWTETTNGVISIYIFFSSLLNKPTNICLSNVFYVFFFSPDILNIPLVGWLINWLINWLKTDRSYCWRQRMVLVGGDVQRYRDTCLEVKLKKKHRARTIHLNSKVMKSVDRMYRLWIKNIHH